MTPFQNPYMNPYGYQIPVQPAIQQQQVVKVNGENGARTFQIGANSSALLLDESGLMVWLITSDGAGYKTVQAYDIAPHKTEPAPDFGSLENRIKKLEEIINGNTGNSAAAEPKQYVPAGPTRKADDEHGPYRAEPAANVKPAYYEQPANEAGNRYSPEARR